jgi:toxin-antitoxin system PIN domain toxin
MSYLLDVNVLLASRWQTHTDHEMVHGWLDELPEFYTTPIVELGFMRVSLSPAYAATWKNAYRSLSALLNWPSHRFLPDDVSGIDSAETSYKDSTDAHLVALADRHGLRLATLDKALTQKPWAKRHTFNPLA